MEMLPHIPEWKSKKIVLTGHPTSEPIHLFYRDALDCVKYLFGNPLFADHTDFHPVRMYQDIEQTIHVYSEWMTGDVAWEIQVNSVSPLLKFFKTTNPVTVNASIWCYPPWCQPFLQQDYHLRHDQ